MTTCSHWPVTTAPSVPHCAARSATPSAPGSGPNGDRTTGRKRREHLQQVPHQIVVHLTVVEHHQTPAVSRKSRFHQLGVHPCQPVPVLHHDHGHPRIGQQATQLRATPVHPGADLDLHADNRVPGPGRPLAQPGHLAIEIRPLVMRRHPGIQPQRDRRLSADRLRSDQDRTFVHSNGWNRQRPVAEPPVCRLGMGMHTLSPRPFGQIHEPKISLVRVFAQYRSVSPQQLATLPARPATDLSGRRPGSGTRPDAGPRSGRRPAGLRRPGRWPATRPGCRPWPGRPARRRRRRARRRTATP